MNSRKIMVKILDKVLIEGAYSNIELSKQLNKYDLNDKDKALITEVVYGTIKQKKVIDSIISDFVNDIKDVNDSVINILRSAIYQLKYLTRVPEFAVLNESVNVAKEVDEPQANFINAVLRNYTRNKNKNFDKSLGTKGKLAYKYSFDDWMVGLFLKQYGIEKVEAILKGLNEVPEVTVRVNDLKGDYDEVFEALQEAGYEVEEGYVCPEAIKIKRGRNIEDNPLFKEGKITVQDESAMLVAPMLELDEDMTVLDLCSAPGGKATHASEIMNNTGEVVASDIYEHKLELIKENCERLGITNIKTEIIDATKLDDRFVDYADGIILDVPCSGLGIIRKKPEIKWNKKREDLNNLVPTQRDIMENSWKYLKEGGIMIYSTCTLNKEENENNVDWFLSKHSDARVEPVFVGNLSNMMYNENKTLTVLPNAQMDGFFIAKIVKL